MAKGYDPGSHLGMPHVLCAPSLPSPTTHPPKKYRKPCKKKFALWLLLALDAASVSTFHTRFTRPQADYPILAVKTKQRAHIFSYAPVSAPVSGRQMVWRHLQCFSIDANNFTRLNNTQCFHVFRSQARMTLTISRVPIKRNICCERLALARRQTDKKTHTGHKRAINSDQNTQFELFSVVGWVWQHQNFTKRQEKTNLSLLRGKRACKTSDAR